MKTLREKILEAFEHKDTINKHLFESKISLQNSPLRIDSDSYIETINAARQLFEAGEWEPQNDVDRFIVEKLDTGKKAILVTDGKRKEVVLDLPKNNPDRAKDKKRFIVYRAGEKEDEETGLPIARTIKFSSWDKGLDINNDDEGAVKSFWARQKCDTKKNPDTPGYWACYAPELFGDKLGLRGGKSRW